MRDRERQRHRQREKQAPFREPNAGLSTQPWNHALSLRQMLNPEPLRCPHMALKLTQVSKIQKAVEGLSNKMEILGQMSSILCLV